MKSRWALAAALVLLTIAVAAKDKKNSPETLANLHFTVLKGDSLKPVRNASVILHPVGKNGQSNAGYQLKTDSDGKTESQGVPYGTLRVQVIAPGFQTFGEDYDVNQPEMNIDIRLKRPTEQFTIYDGGGKNGRRDDGSPQQGTPVPQPPPK
jgi:hypothetical protein